MMRLVPILFSFLILAGCTATADSAATISEKRIALSYDDAPRGDGLMFDGIERTQAMIKAWDTAKTGPVVIFATTQGMAEDAGRARIQSYADAGHLIANHSHSHDWASRTDTEAYIADIEQAEVMLDGLPNRRPWYRFPYLDEGGYGDEDTALPKRDRLRETLAERGLMSGYVTVDTYDWHLDSLWQNAVRGGMTVDKAALAQVYVDMVVDAANHYDRMGQTVLGRHPAHVLLLHENDLAASFTVEMVTALRADGWTIIDPDEAFADPIASQLPKTRFSGAGRIAALGRDAGLSGPEDFDHWSTSEAGIEARLSADSVFTD